ncbi:MAG: YaiO family outer membrane beta-barrel protein [Gammaproteobacteria bacterium]
MMTKTKLLCVPFLLFCAASASAADNRYSLTSERTDYSGSFGKRQETTVESTTGFGDTSFVVGVSHAKRDFNTDSFSALQLSGTVYHDWSDRLYTRSSVTAASNKPVFATREFAQDINYKILSNTVVTVGGKYARYYGDRQARSLSVGGTQYFGGGYVSYRYSAFDLGKLGRSHSHLATFRLKDGKGAGSTQLWLGMGTALHELQLQPGLSTGKSRGITLQRVQPIKGPVAFNIAIGRAWYDTPAGKYHGTLASIGLTLTSRRIF